MRVDDILEGGEDHPVKSKKVKTGIGTIVHNVHILDASGSMNGGKYNSAVEGIKAEIIRLKGLTDLEYTQTVVEFEGTHINTVMFMEPIKDCPQFNPSGTGGATPLLQAMGETLTKLKAKVKPGEKTVVTVCTDGGENSSTGEFAKASVVKALIKDLEDNHGFNVNYMATEFDAKIIERLLDAKDGNVIVHDNTAAGLKKVYLSRSDSMSAYSCAVADGASDEELSRGFFKR